MRNLAYLNKYLWKYRGRLFIGFLFICLANIGNAWAPQVVKDGIDFLVSALKQKDASEIQLSVPYLLSWLPILEGKILQPELASTLIRIGLLLGAAYLVIYIFKGIFLFYQRQTIIVMSRYIEYDLKNEIYGHYQKMDTAFFKQNRTGDLMNRISEDVNRVRMYLGPAIMYIINLVVMTIVCVIFMVRENLELTLYALSPLPVMMIIIFYVSKLINKRTDKVQAQQSRLSAIVQEAFSGIRVLKAFRREQHAFGQFDKECVDYKHKQLGLVKVDALFMPVMILLVGLSTILTIYVGGLKVISGQLTIGVLFQFVIYINLMTWPFAMVGWVSSLVQKAEASQARINEFLQTQPSIQNHAHEKISAVEGEIEFRNVSFTYPDSGTVALKNVSFKVKRGETLAVIGRTGSGKSTIAQLLSRMYDVSEGEILLDGKPLHEHDLYHLRKSIGYVPQDVFLFSDTVKNNIAFGEDDLSDEEIIQSAKDADVDGNIVSFPKQYETLLGERGINLSGGQKQRVSIARALVKDPSILILDDCLSSVDTETEENILVALKRIMIGRTSVITSHRISSIRHADKIIVLDHGTLAEEGTHESLLAKNGLYAALFRKQLLADVIERVVRPAHHDNQ